MSAAPVAPIELHRVSCQHAHHVPGSTELLVQSLLRERIGKFADVAAIRAIRRHGDRTASPETTQPPGNTRTAATSLDFPTCSPVSSLRTDNRENRSYIPNSCPPIRVPWGEGARTCSRRARPCRAKCRASPGRRCAADSATVTSALSRGHKRCCFVAPR